MEKIKFLVQNKIKLRQVLFAFLLCLAAVFVFYPVLNADFIFLDDPVMVSENRKIKSFSSENLKEILFKPHYSLYHPLVSLSYALEYRFFKLDPYFYHAGNLLLHLFNTLFVFFIFFRLSGKNFYVSFLTALIFACHPMHVEPVAWVSSRKDTLYAFFFLASWLMYLKTYTFARRKKIVFFSASLFLFFCACISKSMAVTLPAVIILCDWFCGEKIKPKTLLKYLPYLLIAAGFSLATFLLYYDPGEKKALTAYLTGVNFITAHFNMLFYMIKFLIPVKLSVVYPYFFEENVLVPDFILRTPALLYALTVLIVYSLKKTKTIFFGFALFVIMISPVINILPTGVSSVSDRYTYLPFIGFSYIVAAGIGGLYDIVSKRYVKNILKIAVTALMVIMCLTSYSKAEKWKDTKTLFLDAVNNYPGGASKSYGMLGMSYNSSGDIDNAKRALSMALFLNPQNGDALYVMGLILFQEKKFEEVLNLYNKIPSGDIHMPSVYITAAHIYFKEEEHKPESYRLMNKALAAFPENSYIHENLGIFYAHDKEYDKALECFKKAKELAPGEDEAYSYTMQIYAITGKYELFRKELEEGLKNCSNKKSILSEAGVFFFECRNYLLASLYFMKLVKQYPSEYEAYKYLGDIERENGNYKKALYYYTMSRMIKNDYVQAYIGRARTHLKYGNKEKFSEDIETAKKLGAEIPKDLL